MTKEGRQEEGQGRTDWIFQLSFPGRGMGNMLGRFREQEAGGCASSSVSRKGECGTGGHSMGFAILKLAVKILLALLHEKQSALSRGLKRSDSF